MKKKASLQDDQRRNLAGDIWMVTSADRLDASFGLSGSVFLNISDLQSYMLCMSCSWTQSCPKIGQEKNQGLERKSRMWFETSEDGRLFRGERAAEGTFQQVKVG